MNRHNYTFAAIFPLITVMDYGILSEYILKKKRRYVCVIKRLLGFSAITM
ncbi:hypothetical protein M1M87_00575 [Thermodesulfovibrionales bacterium]|nr:hypothetical protein [Thermodesulfovibrionales bacterium]MCL0042098.1 hypothetical protein [Thermodesulfovibrionales bacterium]MCL0046730.1 hypothetical protein [Thermodesulfovibrionales bacterium]MCL0049890.1 hypothetical protein [Thermodesulfovibrionales bacterium]MCL0051103.1 hypothetical protein [Thermodesulfovibrionales bacterium]